MNAKPQRTRTPSADLFPETLLVTNVNGQPQTDSLKFSEYFHKAHKNVLRTIEQVIADVAEEGGSGLTFELTSYKVKQSKPRPMYLMDRKAFAVLAGRFTGKKALLWQIQYHEAFEAMEAQLHAQAEREAHALYQVRPRWQPIARNPGLSRQELIALTGHRSPASVTACRQRMREVGLLPGVPGGQKQSGHRIALTEGGAA